MKPILFVDFYNTLSKGVFWHPAPEDLKERIEVLLFSDDARNGITDSWMRGLLTSEEVHIHIARELHVEYELLWKLFVESTQTLGVDEEALQMLGQFEEHYELVLITDNMDAFTRFVVPAYKLDTIFSKIVNSADVGIRKHDGDGKIFKLVAEEMKGSILIDDSENVCALFEGMGGLSLRVDSQNDLLSHLHALQHQN